MKSSSKIFGVILSGCLMLASGCVVVDPADEADYVEAEWADELLEEGMDDLGQDEAAGSQGYEITAEDEAAPEDLPDPFGGGKRPADGGSGGGTGG
ncbi:MAG TPA: hypothetical protein VNM90_08790 [Haliangium sp.]|nr:hypothetical protein [Haliangium sp.]